MPCCNSIVGHHISTNFCTCHYSTAVVFRNCTQPLVCLLLTSDSSSGGWQSMWRLTGWLAWKLIEDGFTTQYRELSNSLATSRYGCNFKHHHNHWNLVNLDSFSSPKVNFCTYVWMTNEGLVCSHKLFPPLTGFRTSLELSCLMVTLHYKSFNMIHMTP